METYICTISEVIKAEFKNGNWIETSVSSGKGVFRITVEGNLAEVVEQGTEPDKIRTTCENAGGTVGFKCEEHLKLTPYRERFDVMFYLPHKEITVDSEYGMRDMDDWVPNHSEPSKKYFDGIKLSIRKAMKNVLSCSSRITHNNKRMQLDEVDTNRKVELRDECLS